MVQVQVPLPPGTNMDPREPEQKPIFTCYLVAKFAIQIVFFVVFLLFFGIPSVRRYMAKGILTNVEQKNFKSFELPAVTICPR